MNPIQRNVHLPTSPVVVGRSASVVQGPKGDTGPAGPTGPQGPAGSVSGSRYTHLQQSASTTWNIAHNLSAHPVVVLQELVDIDEWQVIDTVVIYIDMNNAQAIFPIPVSGRADCT